jgi:hypothetical protein
MRRNSMRRKGCERGPALPLMMLFAGKFGEEMKIALGATILPAFSPIR